MENQWVSEKVLGITKKKLTVILLENLRNSLKKISRHLQEHLVLKTPNEIRLQSHKHHGLQISSSKKIKILQNLCEHSRKSKKAVKCLACMTSSLKFKKMWKKHKSTISWSASLLNECWTDKFTVNN